MYRLGAWEIGAYDSGAGWHLLGGVIEECGHGLGVCRLCRRMERLPIYAARSGLHGKRLHVFGLHLTCGRAYFARRAQRDLTVLIDDLDLVCIVTTGKNRMIFSLD